MIDTIALESPPISEETAQHIESMSGLILKEGINLGTGELQYTFTSGSFQGSYESSIGVQVHRTRKVCLPPTGKSGSKSTPCEVACDPYVTINGSVHKAIMGHNVFAGPERVADSCAWFVHRFEKDMGVSLPDAFDWKINQIDITEVYDLGSTAAVQQYIQGLKNTKYPRRPTRAYDNNTLMFTGSITALKYYAKGPEFKKKGYRHLANRTNVAYAAEVQRIADPLLRVELSVRKRKLKQLSGTGEAPTLKQLDYTDLIDLHDSAVSKISKEAASSMSIVRRDNEVMQRLQEQYEFGLAGRLYAFWSTLAGPGEAAAKKATNKSSFYRMRKQLIEAGIAWDNTNIKRLQHESLIPLDFTPSRNSKYRVSGESIQVKEALLREQLA